MSSGIIDERIVSLKFDNENFEEKISGTLAFIDKLKTSLSGLTGKELSSLGDSVKEINVNPLTTSLDGAKAGFSALDAIAFTTMQRITNAAIDTGKKLLKAFTIKYPKEGMQEYEEQINSTQTIMANTGKGVKDVNKALDELNDYADLTIYNFSTMTKNAGMFTAAGVSLEDTMISLKGIGNWAAYAGANTEQMGRVTYQLGQSLATGSIKLRDWMSVENAAGMAGKLYREAFMETARQQGIAVDEIVEKNGGFRESLKTGWLTTEIFMKTMKNFANDQSMTDAATKIKTLSQLFDTLGEAMGTGWATSWRIIVGDFEEAKSLFTGIGDELITAVTNFHDARNELLQGWKDLGGRDDLITAGTNAWKGLVSVLGAVKEGLSNAFPKIAAENLKDFTGRIADMSQKLIPSEKTISRITKTFEAGGTVIKIFGKGIGVVVGFLKELAGLALPVIGDGVGGFIDSFAAYIEDFDAFIKKEKPISTAITNIVDNLRNLKDRIKQKYDFNGLELFRKCLEQTYEGVKKLGGGVTSILGNAINALTESLTNGNFEKAIDALAAGSFAVFMKNFSELGKMLKNDVSGMGSLKKFIDGLLKPVSDNTVTSLKKVQDALSGFETVLVTYQNQIKAATLLEIAAALGILAISLQALSSVSEQQMGTALGGLTAILGELVAAYAILDKLGSASNGSKGFLGAIQDRILGTQSAKNFSAVSMSFVKIAGAILILTSAVKKIADIPKEQLQVSVTAIGFLMAELGALSYILSSNNVVLKSKTAVSLLIMSAAVKVMAKAISNLKDLNGDQIQNGVKAIGELLVAMAGASVIIGKYGKSSIGVGVSLMLMATAMNQLVKPMEEFSKLDSNELGMAFLSMASAIGVLAGAAAIMPKSSILTSGALVVGALAIKMLVEPMKEFAKLNGEQIGRGITVIAGSFVSLGASMLLFKAGGIQGAIALVTMAASLKTIIPVFTEISKMEWNKTGEALVKMVSILIGLGATTAILGVVSPLIVKFGLALVVLGAGIAAIGGGLTLIATSFATLSAGLAATHLEQTFDVKKVEVILNFFKSMIKGLVNLIPNLVTALVAGIAAFLKAFRENINSTAESLAGIILDTLKVLNKYAPAIANEAITLLINILNVVSSRMGEFVDAGYALIESAIVAIWSKVKNMDGSSFENGVKIAAILAIFTRVLSGILPSIPGALAGLAGVGLLMTELTFILAGIGAIAQLPYLEWFIGEGGNLLQKIGEAIGKFFGGIGAGVVEGVSSSFPQLGASLSQFYNNAKDFFMGVKDVGPDTLTAIDNLSSAILKITAADILDSVAGFVTGGHSLTQFASELRDFGTHIAEFSNTVSGKIDGEAVTSAANAGKIIAEMASSLPNSGGLVGLAVGNNDLGTFAESLVPFGKGISKFADSVKGIDTSGIAGAKKAATMVVELSKSLPNSGGVAGFFAGSKNLATLSEDLIKFGNNLSAFANKVAGLDGGATAGVSNMLNNIKNVANIDVAKLNSIAGALGKVSTAYSNFDAKNMTKQIDAPTINSDKAVESAKAANTALNNAFKIDISAASATMKNAANTAISSFASAISAGTGKAKGAVTSMANNAASGARNYSGFHSAGYYCVSGFASGISANTWMATAKARAMASAALSAAKSALKEHSPSKETYEMGKYFDQGFGNAIEDYTPGVIKSIDSMMDGAKDGMIDSIKRTNEVMDRFGNLAPVVRPIMDMTNIEEGASRLNSLLNNSAIYTPVYAMAGIADSMDNRASNDDVVSAINNLRGDIQNSGKGNVYNIDGITYDDGDNINSAVETLIDAIILGGRE